LQSLVWLAALAQPRLISVDYWGRAKPRAQQSSKSSRVGGTRQSNFLVGLDAVLPRLYIFSALSFSSPPWIGDDIEEVGDYESGGEKQQMH